MEAVAGHFPLNLLLYFLYFSNNFLAEFVLLGMSLFAKCNARIKYGEMTAVTLRRVFAEKCKEEPESSRFMRAFGHRSRALNLLLPGASFPHALELE